MNRVEQIEQIVKRECDSVKSAKLRELFWRHINDMRSYAVELAKRLKANVELVEIAALLHDIGHIKFGREVHEKTSSDEAEKILQKLSYDEDFIKRAKKIILAHRDEAGSKEEQVVICADAMAHFDVILSLASIKGLDVKPKEAVDWHREKMIRAWEKISQIPEAKNILQKEYSSIKQFFRQ